MIIRYRNYPNSSKLTYKNGLLTVLNIIVMGVIFAVLAFIVGGPSVDLNTRQKVIILVITLVCFYTLQARINNYTDKQYVEVLEEYANKIEELTPENPKELVLEGQEEVENKYLTHPAKVKLTRLNYFVGIVVKHTYYINDVAYKLSNAKSVEFTTDKTVNKIEIKRQSAKKILYFTVSENEEVELKFLGYEYKGITRTTSL